MSSGIDWVAVDFVVNGSQLALRPCEKRAVIRRLADRMRPIHATNWDTRWKWTSEDIADRMYVSARQVQRMKDELPQAEKTLCPVCGQDMWVWVNGVVEAHPDALNQECPMSCEVLVEQTWESKTALTIVWLAQRLRAGDSVGVWGHLAELGVDEMRPLLIAALAAVPEDGNPFAWLSDVEETAA